MKTAGQWRAHLAQQGRRPRMNDVFAMLDDMAKLEAITMETTNIESFCARCGVQVQDGDVPDWTHCSGGGAGMRRPVPDL